MTSKRRTAARANSSLERHYTVDELYHELTVNRKPFWDTVYPLYMNRDITRADVRDLVTKALTVTMGSYKLVNSLFNSPKGDYKRFLNFLHKHNLQVEYKSFRSVSVIREEVEGANGTHR